jgi:hypothetical protein
MSKLRHMELQVDRWIFKLFNIRQIDVQISKLGKMDVQTVQAQTDRSSDCPISDIHMFRLFKLRKMGVQTIQSQTGRC